MHVVSNTSNDMYVGSQLLEDGVDQLDAVAMLLDSKHTRYQLKAFHFFVFCLN